MLMEVNPARVIQAITNTQIEIPENEEATDMCKAIDDMMNDSRAEGRAEGVMATLVGLVRDGLLSVKDAAPRVNMTESNFEAEMKRLS